MNKPINPLKKQRLSDQLAQFLGKPSGSVMACTAVTREINNYIRVNRLQNKENGRKINPDSKLATLLKLKSTDELTYINLQKYLRPHYLKASTDAWDPFDAFSGCIKIRDEINEAKKSDEIKEFEERFKREEKEQRYQEFKSKKVSNIAHEIVNYVPFAIPVVVATPI